MRALGNAELSADRLALEVQVAGAHAFGWFLHGTSTPQVTFGSAQRCLTAPVVGLGSSRADASGRLGLRVDLSTSRLVPGPATFQAILRDPGTGRLLATDAVTLVLCD